MEDLNPRLRLILPSSEIGHVAFKLKHDHSPQITTVELEGWLTLIDRADRFLLEKYRNGPNNWKEEGF